MDGSGDPSAGIRLPEVPMDPMEFLSRSWSVSVVEVSKALAATHFPAAAAPLPEEPGGEADEAAAFLGNPFSFASSATSQLVMDRILSQSQDTSPRTSGRLSHSSGPLNGGGSITDSPPVSPDIDDVKSRGSSGVAKPRSRTVGRWLKDRRERKKEEARAHNAQLHAAVSVAGVAAAVAAIAAATAAASGSGSDARAARTDLAVASAATLVAAQCVEAAEALGAERDHLASIVASAVNVKTPGDIITLTAAAATALRGAATLKARALKEVWNAATIIPVEKGSSVGRPRPHGQKHVEEKDEDGEDFRGLCSQELLARGAVLLKRTRKGVLHWKMVSVYINQAGQVMLKLKSRHVAGTIITKKKKSVVIEVCKETPAWPGRNLLEGGEQRRYFGLKTAELRVIEFECKGRREYEMWTQGVSALLTTAGGVA